MEIIKEDDVALFAKMLPHITLEPATCHLVMLAVRSRKAKLLQQINPRDMVVERKIVRPIADWRDRYFNVVHNVALLGRHGNYLFDDWRNNRKVLIDGRATAVYGTIAPRNVRAAAKSVAKDIIEHFAGRQDPSVLTHLTRVDVEFFGNLHASPSGGHYVTVDIDAQDPDTYKEAKDMVSVLPHFMKAKCSRGKHIILDLTKPENARDFYTQEKDGSGRMKGIIHRIKERWVSDALVEIRKDSQEPIPGTFYAGPKGEDNWVEFI